MGTKSRTTNGTTNRPVAKLFPLEVSAVCETNTVIEDGNVDHQHNNDQDESTTVREQLTRNDDIRAGDHIKGWTDILSVAPEDVIDSN